MLHQQRAAGRADKGHQNIELLVGKTDHFTANKIDGGRERAAAGLQLIGRQRLGRTHTRRQQRRHCQQAASPRQRIDKSRQHRNKKQHRQQQR
ncbi:hypothetical protein D3C72_1570670 [compost metagenome]